MFDLIIENCLVKYCNTISKYTIKCEKYLKKY